MIALEEHAKKFAQQMVEIIKSAFGVNAEVSSKVTILDTLTCDKELYSALMITGSFYGEYIIGFNMDSALNIIGLENDETKKTENFNEIKNTFGEFLNIVAGAIFPELKKKDIEINLTAPRFYKGQLYYPGIKVAKVSITVENNSTIDCFFYTDMMNLDINKSYKEALTKLYKGYKDLQTAQKKLIQQQAKLVQTEKIAAIGVLSAGIAHNLNTPLGTISLSTNQIEHLVDSSSDKTAILRTIKLIKKTTYKMSDMIKVLHDFSKNIEVGGFKQKEIGSLVSSAVQEFQTAFKPEDNNIALHSSFAKKEPILFECSPSEFKKIILCLLQNAQEALLDQVENLDQNNMWISIDVSDTDDCVIFEIANGGPKISEDLFNKIFDPFYTSKDASHSGLGLSLAKGIIGGHGGTISFNRDSDNTSFIVRLPKQQNIGILDSKKGA